jgi:hypothetical protein
MTKKDKEEMKMMMMVVVVVVLVVRVTVFFNSIVWGGGVESNWVHSTLRPPMAYCASPG